MARTPSQRGRIGAWLVQARLARGYATQVEARREIERLAGWRIPQSQYAEWESGRRVPSDAALERLQGFYGVPETPEALPTGDLATLVAEMREQNRLMASVVSELREYRLLTADALRGQATTQKGIEDGILALADAIGSAIPLGVGRPKRTPDGPAGRSRTRARTQE